MTDESNGSARSACISHRNGPVWRLFERNEEESTEGKKFNFEASTGLTEEGR